MKLKNMLRRGNFSVALSLLEPNETKGMFVRVYPSLSASLLASRVERLLSTRTGDRLESLLLRSR